MSSRLAAWVLLVSFVLASRQGISNPITVCSMSFWLDKEKLEFRASPATFLPGMTSLLLAVRDVNAQNCSIVEGCKERLRSRQGCWACS